MRSLSSICILGVLCTTRSRLRIAGVAGALLLTGCSAPGSTTPGFLDGLLGPEAASQEAPQKTARASTSDRATCGTAAQCRGVLKTMINSPDRGWIGKQQSPDAYANGTRLFAYRALRKRLTCNELSLAVGEVRAASRSLGGSVPGMTPEQQSRTRALSTEVEGELAKERARRCRS